MPQFLETALSAAKVAKIGSLAGLPRFHEEVQLLDKLRPRREITAPSGLSFCPPAAPQKGLHISDMRPFFRLAGEQKFLRHMTQLFPGEALGSWPQRTRRGEHSQRAAGQAEGEVGRRAAANVKGEHAAEKGRDCRKRSERGPPHAFVSIQ